MVLVRAGIDRRATAAEIGRAGGELTSTVPAGASRMNQVVDQRMPGWTTPSCMT